MESESVWRALASPHRRRILDLIRDGAKTTGELSRELPSLSRFAVMQHLGVLEEAGLVLYRREGKQRFNYANPVPLREMYERWVEPRSSSAAETAQHLKRYAENTHQVGSQHMNEYRLVKIELEMRIAAPRERVFAALTSELGNWWPFRYKPDSEVYCDPRVGGELGERFANGGGATYGQIVYLDPPYKVASSSPSSLNKGNSSYSVDTLEIDGEGTLYKREMTMWGDVPPETEKMFRDGTREFTEKALKAYLEEGRGYSPEVNNV